MRNSLLPTHKTYLQNPITVIKTNKSVVVGRPLTDCIKCENIKASFLEKMSFTEDLEGSSMTLRTTITWGNTTDHKFAVVYWHTEEGSTVLYSQKDILKVNPTDFSIHLANRDIDAKFNYLNSEELKIDCIKLHKKLVIDSIDFYKFDPITRINPKDTNIKLSKITTKLDSFDTGWTPVGKPSSLLNTSFGDVVYYNDIFITSDSSYVYWSTDADTWYSGTAGCGKLTRILYIKGLFVGCSSKGLYYSIDGKTWTVSNITSSINTFYYGGGMWVAVSNSGIYSSSDGKTWTSRHSGTYKDVFYAKGVWIAAGQYIMKSTNGTSWSAKLQATDLGGGQSTYIYQCVYQARGKWIVGRDGWHMVCSTNGGDSWSDVPECHDYMLGPHIIYYANGMWVAGSNDYLGLAYSKDNGNTWGFTSISEGVKNVLYTDDRWIVTTAEDAIGFSSDKPGSVYSSTDGVNYTEHPISGTNGMYSAICYGYDTLLVATNRAADVDCQQGLFYSKKVYIHGG